MSLFLYFLLVLLVSSLLLASTALFPSNRSSPVKFFPYESGITVTADLGQHRFPLRYYLVALLFLLFDVEAIFIYPWAIVAKEIGAFAFYEMAFFILILLLGFFYAWRKGGFQWE